MIRMSDRRNKSLEKSSDEQVRYFLGMNGNDDRTSIFPDYYSLPIYDTAPQRLGLDVENVNQGNKEPKL
jgi:hypothetical protein